jgi:hypothetical protein
MSNNSSSDEWTLFKFDVKYPNFLKFILILNLTIRLFVLHDANP